jgi:hypothetical protein
MSSLLARCGLLFHSAPASAGCQATVQLDERRRIIGGTLTSMGLRAAEWLPIAFFSYLLLCTGLLPAAGPRTRSRRLATAAMALAAILLVVSIAHITPGSRVPMVVRDWAPMVYLVLGYWLPAGIGGSPAVWFESRLMAFDRWLLGPDHASWVGWRTRASTRVAVEIIYPCVYLMVPACFALSQSVFVSAAAGRFWTTVLLAGYVCYGTLPWLYLRPPRGLPDPDTTLSTGQLRTFNEWFLDTTSVGACTFPSGHVATACGAALIVTEASPAAGLVFLVLTALIATATVAGRYHYAIDAITGLLTGVSAWALVRMLA